MTEEWTTLAISDVAEVFDGPHATPKTVDSGPIFLGIGALQDGHINLSETRHVTREDFKKWTRRVCPRPGDVVFSYETRLGQAAMVPEGLECCLGRRMGLVRFDESRVEPQFFLYQYLSPQYQEYLGSKTVRGATVDRISIRDFPAFTIVLPPLAEQKRIVAILDEAFAGIDKAVANAEKNLANARELLESYLNWVFAWKGEGWTNTTLGDVLDIQPRNGWSPPAAHHADSGVPVLTLSSVTGFMFRGDKIKFTSAPTDSKCHYWVKNGDLLITRSNTPELVGHVAIAAGLQTPTIYPDLIMRMVPKGEKALTDFLYYQLRTAGLRAEITGRAQGANPTMKKISKGAVQTLPISVPSLDIQAEIVGKLRAFGAESDRLIAIASRRLASLGTLRHSILHKAFTGELTANAEQALAEAAV